MVTTKSERTRTSTDDDDDEVEDAMEHFLALEGLEDEAEPTEAEKAWADALVERIRAESDWMLQGALPTLPRPKG
jgi:hypothetical protein